MRRAHIPDRVSYEQREDWRLAAHYKSAWPIDDPPSNFHRRDEPTLNPGDLVGWVKHPDADLKEGWYTPMWRDKHNGLVLMTRWVVADWLSHEGKEPDLFPEALILWNDGDTTNTSQACLQKL